MTNIGIEPLIADVGLIANDVCGHHETLNRSDRVADALNRHSGACAEGLDTPVYYGVSFR